MNRQIVAMVGTIGLACARPSSGPPTATPVTRYVAPSDQTIIAEVESSFDGESIHVLNNSTVPVVITSVHVYQCENIATPCTVIRLQIPVASHQRKRVATVRPADPQRSYSYQYRWTWRTGEP